MTGPRKRPSPIPSASNSFPPPPAAGQKIDVLQSKLAELAATVEHNSTTIEGLPTEAEYADIATKLDEVKGLLNKQDEMGKRLWNEQLVLLALLIASWLVTLTLLFRVLRVA
jgi:hypothetical protein